MSGNKAGQAYSLWREALIHLTSTVPAREEIARRAYVKYLAYGERSRDAVRDWLEAEAELTAGQRPAERRVQSGGAQPSRGRSGTENTFPSKVTI
jgi:hypothetical protein